jgi:hypothetical protein
LFSWKILWPPGTLVTILALILLPTDSIADNINPGIFAKDSSPYGIPYRDWIAKWWQWTMSIPASEHPRDSYTQEKCRMNQEGPVWFLPDQLGGREERSCTVPSGKAILIPLLTGECDYGVPEVKNDQDLRRCAMAGNEYGVIQATIDGRMVMNLEQYRTQSGLFNITIPADNIYQAPPGVFEAMVDGFFVFLEPPSPGRHEVNLKVSVLNPIETNYNYNAEWTYHLTVLQ